MDQSRLITRGAWWLAAGLALGVGLLGGRFLISYVQWRDAVQVVHLQDHSIAWVWHGPVWVLDHFENEIESATPIAYLFTTVTEIWLHDRDARAAALLPSTLTRFPDVRVLKLSRCELNDSHLQFLEDLPKLEVLDLSQTKVTDRGLARLERLTALRKLVLSDTAIGNMGMESVGRLTSLESLDLDHTKVSDEGLSKLRALSHLEVLHVVNTATTESGTNALARAIPGLTIFDD
jgi:hypothetical protein